MNASSIMIPKNKQRKKNMNRSILKEDISINGNKYTLTLNHMLNIVQAYRKTPVSEEKLNGIETDLLAQMLKTARHEKQYGYLITDGYSNKIAKRSFGYTSENTAISYGTRERDEKYPGHLIIIANEKTGIISTEN